MPFHFRDGGRERVAAGRGRRGRGQGCLRSGCGRRFGRRCVLSSMSSYDMLRCDALGWLAGIPGNGRFSRCLPRSEGSDEWI
ncbi:hypothetical protein DF121_23310 [Burkholderia stagnalis]|nr:hypothetical protein DF145_34120 [Burkholderia stagnalis]RQX95855.1 hypothetical protein DF121_23310 [Burkholderia stagnalis]RQY11602.1 hypothetical protein DF115_24985 [Burkholderia stagnalis]RQY28085.1 hypothetical protein DF114_23915 [Burkholderia stagnalis]